MDYEYTLPTTGAFYFPSALDQTESILSTASNHRAQLRDILKKLKRSNDKDTLSVIRIIEDYLPLLFEIFETRTKRDEASDLDTPENGGASTLTQPSLSSLTTSWRATFLDNKIPGKAFPRLDMTGITYEVGFVLLTYAYALSNYASISTLPATKASELLCKAAGIFEYHHSKLMGGESSNNKTCPEVFPQFSACLMNFTLGNAQMVSLRQLEEKASHSILCRVAVGASDHYSAAIGVLSSHPMLKHIPTDFRDHLSKAQQYALSRAYLYLGMDQEKSAQVGFAIGCAQQAESLYKDATTSDLLRSWTKQNAHVTFQPVMSKAEVQTKLPSGREFVKITAFVSPAAAKANDTKTERYAGAGNYY